MSNPWILAHASLAYFALTMTIISLWVKRSPWIWGSFLIFAFILGYFAQLVQSIALVPIAALLFLHSVLKGQLRGLPRLVLVLLATAISLGLWFHYFPGFQNWRIIKDAQISANAYPFSLYLTFDKPFIGIFILALGFPLVSNLHEFGKVMKTAIPMTIAGMTILLGVALYLGQIAWDPKFLSIFWLFFFQNLIFTVIPEETFMRGFIQNEFFKGFGSRGGLASTASVLLTALLFATLHYVWAPNATFLILIFLAGIIYGTIYQLTQSLEASILCHFVFNLTHLLLFTYPAIKVMT